MEMLIFTLVKSNSHHPELRAVLSHMTLTCRLDLLKNYF